MEKYIVLNNDNFDGTNFYWSDIACESTAVIPGYVSRSAGAEKNFFGTPDFSQLLKKPPFKVVFSLFRTLGFAVKSIFLFAFSLTYFIVGGIGVLLYVIFYEKLFKTLLISLENNRPKSPYSYKWKKHHLEFYYEA